MFWDQILYRRFFRRLLGLPQLASKPLSKGQWQNNKRDLTNIEKNLC